MDKSIITIALLVFFFASSSKADPYNFTFNGFNGANLSLNGSSITSNGLLQLTSESQFLVGHAFYPSPMNLKDQNPSNTTISSFSTCFVFGVIPHDRKRGGGHGIAFVFSPLTKLAEGSPGHFLGLFNPNNDRNPSNHVFAVEFDTVGASVFEDPYTNHVGIDINGMNTSSVTSAVYYLDNATSEDIVMESGDPIMVWIEYDGVHEYINVTLAPSFVPIKPSKPLLSTKIDTLSSVLTDSMYVGFSSATGKLASSHYILGWSFQVNGTAQAIDPHLLPSLPHLLPSLPPAGSSSSSKSKHKLYVLIPVTLLVLGVLALTYLYWLRRNREAESLEDWELDCPHRFRYKDLSIATKGFKASEIVGVGGFGTVYKGVLPTTSEQIAVKRILHNSKQGIREFVAEIESLGRLRHKNLVHLLGWCKRDDDLLLVYDFVPNGSLDVFLIKARDNFVLSWERRFKIVKGIASALVYLHQDWEQIVVHRDIKASNILLDIDMNGRLGDFGLARLYDHGENPRTTHLVGTLGYIAPELARTGKATASSDVFAYGTLLLVVACGKGPISSVVGHSTLLEWVTGCYRGDQLMDVVDPKLGSSYVIKEMEMVLKLGLLCSHSNPNSRPTMRQVMRILDGDDELPTGDLSSDQLEVDNVKSMFEKMDPKNVITSSQCSSIAAISTNSFGGGR